MKKITTFLTFDNRAEEAVNFYVSIFPNSKITSTTRYGENGPGPKGSLMAATFELGGVPFYALNGGPTFSFTQGISLFVPCETQAEIDVFWDNLLAGGKALQCGWVQDKFGIVWQIVPTILGELLGDSDAAKAGRAMKAMLGMVKLDIQKLKDAHAGV